MVRWPWARPVAPLDPLAPIPDGTPATDAILRMRTRKPLFADDHPQRWSLATTGLDEDDVAAVVEALAREEDEWRRLHGRLR